MARLFVTDTSGWMTVDLEANGPILQEALEHEQAEPVVRCAVLMALSALAEGGVWPTAVLQSMAAFMAAMKDEMRNGQLI